jgi:exopolysaccharide biosynthesis operon protein EpsL
MRNRFLMLALSMVCGTTLAGAGGAAAATTEAFRPYVEASTAHDSNLFRVSGDAEALSVLGTTDMADTIHRLSAGFDSDISLSRQRVVLHANVDRKSYTRFSDLDHTGGKGDAVWHWRVGDLWSGDIDYGYSRALSGFQELQSRIRNIRTRQTTRATATYQFHPRWQFTAGAGGFDLENSAEERRQNDRRETFGELEATFASPAGTRTGLWGRVTDAELPNREVVATSLVDNSYQETRLGLLGRWPATGHSEFDGRVGYTKREHAQIAQRDFDGTTGQLMYQWQATGKTRLDASLWRDIHAVDDEIASYVVDQGGGVGASWSATDKLQWRINVERKRFDYAGDPGQVLSTLAPRQDTLKLAGVSLTYTPLQAIQIVLLYEATSRDSNRADAGYRDRYTSAALLIGF